MKEADRDACEQLRNKLPLHGNGAETSVLECHLLMEEFRRVKKARETPTGAGGGAGAGTGAGVGAEGGVAESTGAGDVTMANVNMADVLAVGEVGSRPPEEETADQKALADVDRIRCHITAEALGKDLRGRFFSQRTTVLVDAATSRVKVTSDYLQTFASIAQDIDLTNFAVCVCAGGRLDLLQSAVQKMNSLWPKSQTYTVTVGTGDRQNRSNKPLYAALCCPGDGRAVPFFVKVPTTAAREEGHSERCLCRDCPLRPASQMLSEVALRK